MLSVDPASISAIEILCRRRVKVDIYTHIQKPFIIESGIWFLAFIFIRFLFLILIYLSQMPNTSKYISLSRKYGFLYVNAIFVHESYFKCTRKSAMSFWLSDTVFSDCSAPPYLVRYS